MNKVYIGKIVNTHGIKGEIRLLSDFPFKDKVFVVGNNILVDDIEYKINSYRRHKMFDMITLDGYNNINDVLFLLKKDVYFDEDNLILNDNEVLVKYPQGIKSVTPGQACVFYDKDECIGGGIIKEVRKNNEKLWYL